MSGLERISQAFGAARGAGRAALMPYTTLGFPRLALAADVVRAIAEAGADLIELGVPFSDPLADGPTIQHSTQVALEQGITLAGCLEIVRSLRRQGVMVPFLLMGYINPILAYGVQRFVRDAAEAGADGLIVPDLPPQEAGELEAACRAVGLALVYLVPPTASPQRIAEIAARSSGFLYLVSLTGVTGARQALPAHLAEFIGRVRGITSLPLAVGFGISNPAQAGAVAQLADGVIVGSALIEAIGRADDPVQAAGDFVCALRAGVGPVAER
jgi:tryptophan synthase alpha chain